MNPISEKLNDNDIKVIKKKVLLENLLYVLPSLMAILFAIFYYNIMLESTWVGTKLHFLFFEIPISKDFSKYFDMSLPILLILLSLIIPFKHKNTFEEDLINNKKLIYKTTIKNKLKVNTGYKFDLGMGNFVRIDQSLYNSFEIKDFVEIHVLPKTKLVTYCVK